MYLLHCITRYHNCQYLFPKNFNLKSTLYLSSTENSPTRRIFLLHKKCANIFNIHTHTFNILIIYYYFKLIICIIFIVFYLSLQALLVHNIQLNESCLEKILYLLLYNMSNLLLICSS